MSALDEEAGEFIGVNFIQQVNLNNKPYINEQVGEDVIIKDFKCIQICLWKN